MSVDEFTKLLKYMQKQFARMDARFEKQSRDVNDLRSDVDAYAKSVEDYAQEMTMIGHQVSLHEMILSKPSN